MAALASWLDARAHRGRWLVRIEDTDRPRCVPDADAFILYQLAQLGMRPDEEVQWQSRRSAHYEQALRQLRESGHAYACGCSRRDIEQALAAQGGMRARHAAAVYPGTCRNRQAPTGPTAWRVRADDGHPPHSPVFWQDRRLGAQAQNLVTEVGDFVVRRADGCWAYQLAVVVDDGLQGITHVVRGEDLADNTPRQLHLQRLLGLPTPVYLHTALVHAPDGQKLSKQTGAQAVDLLRPLQVLQEAARVLELQVQTPCTPAGWAGRNADADESVRQRALIPTWLEAAVPAWAERFGPG